MLRSLAFDRRKSALASGWLGSFAVVVAACVTSSDAPMGTSPDVDASTDGGEADTSSPPTSDGGDEPGCGNGQTICGTSCVDLATSKEHCGRCDHDCGGGECIDSVCQPTMLVESLPSTAALDVSDDAFFFTKEGSVLSCPTAGCPEVPKIRCTVQGMADDLLLVKTALVVRVLPKTSSTQRALFACRSDVESEPVTLANGLSEGVDGVTSNAAGGVSWATSLLTGTEVQSRLYVGTCSDAGCSSNGILTSASFATDRLAANDTDVFYRSASQSTFGPAQDLWRCGIANGGQQPKKIGSINGETRDTIAMRAFDAGLGVAINTNNGKTLQGQLFVCRQGAMGQACDLLGDPLPELRDFTVDADRLYFAGEKSIWTCPREGCKGSPPILAKSAAIANDSLRTTSKYVYWLAGKDERAVWRVAKP